MKKLTKNYKSHIDERSMSDLKKKLGGKLEVKIGDTYYYNALPEKIKLKDGKVLEIVVSSVEQENNRILHSLLKKLENI